MSLSPEEEILLSELVYSDTADVVNDDKDEQFDKTKDLLEKFANNEAPELDVIVIFNFSSITLDIIPDINVFSKRYANKDCGFKSSSKNISVAIVIINNIDITIINEYNIL